MRLGLIAAGVYLLAAVPCACMHWYEYSIPMMIVYYLSLPAVYGLHFLLIWIPNDHFVLQRSMLIVSQAIIYFLVAEVVSLPILKIRKH